MNQIYFLAAEAAKKPQPVLGLFVEKNVGAFFLMLFMTVIVWVMIARARGAKKIPAIRKLAGLDAIDEAIGRATEMGRPVHFSPGLGGVTDPETFAFFATLGHVAKQAARYDTRLINTHRNQYVYAIADEIIRQAYLEAGRPDAYNPDDVRYLSPYQFAYASGVIGIFQREKIAANLMIGYFYAEALIFAEAGYQAGAIQVAGTTSTAQLPFFVAACDYTLIGEEIYAGSAYLSKDPVLTGSVVGQDIAKIGIFLLILVGTIIANFNNFGAKSNFLKDLLLK